MQSLTTITNRDYSSKEQKKQNNESTCHERPGILFGFVGFVTLSFANQ
jgi:hypothetical protein